MSGDDAGRKCSLRDYVRRRPVSVGRFFRVFFSFYISAGKTERELRRGEAIPTSVEGRTFRRATATSRPARKTFQSRQSSLLYLIYKRARARARPEASRDAVSRQIFSFESRAFASHQDASSFRHFFRRTKKRSRENECAVPRAQNAGPLMRLAIR